MVDGQIAEFLQHSAGPANRSARRAVRRSQAKEDILAVLRKKARSSLQRSRLAIEFSFHRHYRADGVTIALGAAQAERDGWRQTLHDVLQEAQLRAAAILEEDFLTAIMIEIGQGKRPSIFQEVQPDHRRNIGERTIAVVRVENISLVTAPRAIGSDQLINRAPSLLVVVRGGGRIRGIGNHLAPEKAVEILARGAGHHAVGDVEIGKAVMIEIPGVARPRPAPDPDTGRAGRILESAAAISRDIPEERIAHGVPVIERPGLAGGGCLEEILH